MFDHTLRLGYQSGIQDDNIGVVQVSLDKGIVCNKLWIRLAIKLLSLGFCSLFGYVITRLMPSFDTSFQVARADTVQVQYLRSDTAYPQPVAEEFDQLGVIGHDAVIVLAGIRVLDQMIPEVPLPHDVAAGVGRSRRLAGPHKVAVVSLGHETNLLAIPFSGNAQPQFFGPAHRSPAGRLVADHWPLPPSTPDRS